MGNCALKPKVLSAASRAPAPEELKDSLLEDEKIDAAKSLSNLFIQSEKKTKEDDKITPEVTKDLETAPTEEAKAPADDQKVKNEDAVGGEKVIVDVKTEAKAEG